MIPRFIHEQLIDNCDILVEKFKEYEKIKVQNNMELKEETAYKETEGKLHYELDFEFITQMAERMASNKGKYEPYNWQKLDNIADLKQSLFRHVLEVMNGNYKDDNREFGHLEAVAINAMFINYQLNKKEVSHSENFKGIINEFKEQPFNPKEKIDWSIVDKSKNILDDSIVKFNANNFSLSYNILPKYKVGDVFTFKNDDSRKYIFLGTIIDNWFGYEKDLAIYRPQGCNTSYTLKPYKDFIKEIQVSPSTKTNTTDSTGLLTEEK